MPIFEDKALKKTIAQLQTSLAALTNAHNSTVKNFNDWLNFLKQTTSQIAQRIAALKQLNKNQDANEAKILASINARVVFKTYQQSLTKPEHSKK